MTPTPHIFTYPLKAASLIFAQHCMSLSLFLPSLTPPCSSDRHTHMAQAGCLYSLQLLELATSGYAATHVLVSLSSLPTRSLFIPQAHSHGAGQVLV
jgi:hypothetical protein